MSALAPARLARVCALASAVLLTFGLACSDPATGPGGPSAIVGFAPSFQVLDQPHQVAAGQRVAVRVRRLSGVIAADTVFTVGSGSGPLQLSIPVRVTADREPMTLTLAILGPAGDSLFTAGPLAVIAVADRAASGPEGPPVAAISLTYVGPGATTMRRVAFAVRDTAVSVGDSAQLVATAFTQAQTPIPGVLFAFRSLDTTRVRVRPNGVVVAGTTRGPALVEVRSFTGLADTARVVVQPRPVAVRLLTGAGQTGTVARPLSVPLAVRVVGNDSLGVRGVTVRFGPAGVARDSVVFTDSTGFAQTIATLPTLAGAGAATATVAAVGGAPTTFGYTAVADTATQLVVTAAPTSVGAGVVFPTVTVEARDAFGNRATSFTRAVAMALTTNPTGATLGGTLSRPAVAGVASFPDLALTNAGSGYVLGASAAGISGGVSGPVAITAGPPASVTLVRGTEQIGNPGLPLADSVQVRVRDAFTNVIAGATVGFSVTAGGGTVGAPTATTDANGLAAVRWTMGAPFGDATLSATAGSASVSALAVVVPVGTTRVWTGTTSTAWGTATNWLPAGVPGAGDVLTIPPKPNQPQLAAATTIAALSVLPTASLALAAPLRVQGSVAVDGTVTGTSPLVLAAPAVASARGTIATLGVRTAVQLSGRLTATTLTVDSVGLLTMQGQVAAIGGTMTVAQQGGIRMAAAAESLLVSGAASFGGTAGCFTTMTAGVLRVSGGLAVPVASGLCGSGTHITELPSSGAQTVAGASATFGTLVLGPIATPASVTFGPSTSWAVERRIIVRTGVTSVLGPATSVSIGTALVDTVGGRWQVNSTVFTAPGVVEVPSTFGVAGGAVQVSAPGSVSFLRQGGAGPITLPGSLFVTDGTLDVGALSLTAAEDLLTTGTGRLRMADPAGSLSVRNAIFGGGSTAGLLLAGQVSISGSLSQQNTTSDSSFAASPGHVLRLVGAAPQDVSFATPGASTLGRLDIAATGSPAVRLASSLVARDSVRLVAGTGAVTASVAGARLFLQGTALRDPSVTLKRWQVPVTVQSALTQLPDTVGASVTLAAPVTLGGANPWRRVRGALVIAAGGQLTMNGTTFVVNDSLAIRGTGARLVMTQGLDSLDVGAAVPGGGGAIFDGDDHTGSLTNGALVVRGRFRQLATTSVRSFVASGAHRLIKFCPAADAACAFATSTDTLHFATGGTGQSVVQSLTIANGSGTQRTATTLSGVVAVNGVYVQTVGAGVVRPATGVSTLRLAGPGATIERLIPTVPGGTVLQPRLLELPRALPVSKPLTGTTVVQPETLAVVGGFGAIAENTTVLDAAVSWLRLSTTGGTSTFFTPGTVANATNVIVDGVGAVLGISPSTSIAVTGDLRTANGGAIVQAAASATLSATNVLIAGGLSTMTAGFFNVRGNFAVTGTGRLLAAAPHTTTFDGDVTSQVIGPMPFDTLLSSFGNLRFLTVNGGPTDTITSSLPVRGYLSIENSR
nr:Ig-like domain-containing protein [Gemmatimonadaceae bacterium]